MASADPTYPLYPVCAFVGFILSVIPLPWHIHAWNSGTCAYMLWTGSACIIFFVNSIVWAGNVDNPSPFWCDISSKIIAGVSVGIPASALCISRRLYYLTAVRTESLTRDDKRKMVIIDLCIAAGAPAIIMVLHYIVQGHRFDIYENIGCFPTVYNTLPAYFLFYMWPVVFGAFSCFFSVMTLRSFWQRRLQFSQFTTTGSSLTMSRYLRLILLALTDIVCTLPLGIYTIVMQNPSANLQPWISWSDTHYHFSAIGFFPAAIWQSQASYRNGMELTRWLPVACAFLFFALFGFAEEAQKRYKAAFRSIMKLLGVRQTQPDKKPMAKPFQESSYQWSKPDLKRVTSTSTTTTHVDLSSSTSKKLNRSLSFSTSASTHVCSSPGGEYELDSYKPMPIDHDVEKLAGLPSPPLSEGDTICYGTPPSYSRSFVISEALSSPTSRGSAAYPDVPQSVTVWDDSHMHVADFEMPSSPGFPPTSPIEFQSLPPPPPRKPAKAVQRVPVPEMIPRPDMV